MTARAGNVPERIVANARQTRIRMSRLCRFCARWRDCPCTSDAVPRHGRREQLAGALPAQDCNESEERREVHDYDRRFLFPRAAIDPEPDQCAAEAPEQEGSLLARPESGDQKMQRQVAARVGV